MTVINGLPRGAATVHPLTLVGFILSSTGVAMAHGQTNWIGLAAFIAAITGLVTAVLGFALSALRMWLEYHHDSPTPPKRRR